VRRHLSREPVDFFEFHCVLLRTDVFPRRDFLDEHFLAHLEHLDLAREIHAAGGSVFLEPDALVRYDNARPFKPYDRAFFELRWGEEWCRQSTERARQKWQLAPDDPALERLARWTAQHRHLMDRTRQPWILRAVPRALARAAARRLGLRGRPQAGVND